VVPDPGFTYDRQKSDVWRYGVDKDKRMEKWMGYLLAVSFVLLAFLTVWQLREILSEEGGMAVMAEEEVRKVEAAGAGRKVVIDAGHGGDDPGKIGVNGTLEKEVNLAIAKKVKSYLEERGVEVIMTREDGESLSESEDENKKLADMQARCALIHEEAPVFAVSIHQNSYTQESVKGPQVFYYTQSEQGKALASCIQDAMNEKLGIERPRQIKANDTYYLLKRTDRPTVIVECGFLSNEEEEELLVTENYQQQVAEAVGAGIFSSLDLAIFETE
jgi:N-acetylmuramoyl-L-alanine amidase